ncbi:MAG: HD domain-containing protein [Patescibacteria group bacterium]
MRATMPPEVRKIAEALRQTGFNAYLVGGCVRDLLLSREPKDWDIATDARPEEIQKIFVDSVYENEFGTVGVKTDSENPALKVVEVTTFRWEGKYTDKRHPDEVRFAQTIEEDLSRRDFTINAMALNLQPTTYNLTTNLVDPYGGQADLKERVIRAVGTAEERFNEDALRLVRAVRFAAELDFQIEFNTRRAIEKRAGLLEMIAKERIRDEFTKMLMSERASAGIILLEELNLLRYVLPELREGLGVMQNQHHIYSVFEHHVRSLDYAAKKNYPLYIRLAALLHDVAKPKTKEGEGPDSTFYNHERVGAKMAVRGLERLHFSKDLIEQVAHLVRYHMFYYNVDEVSAAGVRRFLVRVGPENVDDLLKLREADRIGSGVPKAVPYKLRHLLYMIEKVKHDPLSPKMLKIGGEDVMRIASITPGPRVGWMLNILLEEVLDDPAKNERGHLENRVAELNRMTDADLTALAEKAREKKDESEKGIEEEMKKRHYVK